MTRHSLVLAAQSNDPATRSRAIEAIAAAYWRPVYKYVRMKWKIAPEDAADFTQEFFTRLLERNSSILTRAVKDACALFYARALTGSS